MADELEMIRQQMAQTRAGMAEKLESLEYQIRDDVHTAATKVSDSVDKVMEQIDTTKASISNTVQSIKETCSVTQQTQKHPWGMMAGAAAVGLISGRLLHGNNSNGSHRDQQITSPPRSVHSDDDVPRVHASAESPAVIASEERQQDVLAKVLDSFRPEIAILKGMAIGAMFGLLRDVVLRSAPPTLEQQLGTAFDGLTVRLGGQPIRGQVFQRKS